MIKRRNFFKALACFLPASALKAATDPVVPNMISPTEFRKRIDEASGEICFGVGTWFIKIDALGFKIKKPLKIRGEGVDKTKIVFINELEKEAFGFQVYSSGFSICELKVEAASKHKDFVMFCFFGETENHCLINSCFYGFSSDSDKRSHAILLANTASVNNVEIRGCTFSGFQYALFTTNKFNGKARSWFVSHCFFKDNFADDIELNSEDNRNTTWDGVFISENRFSSTRVGRRWDSGFAIGIDSARKVIISNNYFSGYPREAVHVEDYLDSVLIESNLFDNCESGIAIYEKEASDVIVSNNIVRHAKSDRSLVAWKIPHPNDATIGIYLTNPKKNSSCTAAKIVNNVISGYDFGIYAPVDRGGVANDNTIYNCGVAIYFPNNSVSPNRNNKIFDSIYAYAGQPFSIGRDSIENCVRLYPKNAQRFVFSSGFDFVARFSKKDIFEARRLFFGIGSGFKQICLVVDYGVSKSVLYFNIDQSNNIFVPDKSKGYYQAADFVRKITLDKKMDGIWIDFNEALAGDKLIVQVIAE